MKVNILKTGSSGNCTIATFSDERQVIFDFGTGAWKECVKANVDFHHVDGVFVTHQHLDHSADYSRIKYLDFPRKLDVERFEVLHSCENYGFIVTNEKTKERFVYATDYYQLPSASLQRLIEIASDRKYKIMMMLELSYCRFLYKRMEELQRIGLQQHCSDERFFLYAKEILNANPAVNIITMHASGRDIEDVVEFNAQKGWNGVVCPPDWLRGQFATRLNGSVRFGEARGMFGSYYFIENLDF